MSDTEAGSDLLYGVKAIALYLELRPRQTAHLIDRGHLPSFKIGGTICARKSSLSEFLAAQEAAARA